MQMRRPVRCGRRRAHDARRARCRPPRRRTYGRRLARHPECVLEQKHRKERTIPGKNKKRTERASTDKRAEQKRKDQRAEQKRKEKSRTEEDVTDTNSDSEERTRKEQSERGPNNK